MCANGSTQRKAPHHVAHRPALDGPPAPPPRPRARRVSAARRARPRHGAHRGCPRHPRCAPATGGIVLSTALQAADLDYRVTVLSDACADPSPALHHTLVNDLLAGRCEVATVAEWARALRAAS
ncbi:isochorismatase family protein [Streptomyces sp. NPDC091387]|uniref:isochorismatase family protein n=1 Tax=Streptomyces sp. NPDC091387 TaxID=3365998 RepID=UPI0037F5B72A